MPEFTQHERAQLHAQARQQIRLVTTAETVEAASNRRFAALGLIQGLVMAGALTAEQGNALVVELQTTTVGQIDALFQRVLADTLPPEPGAVHCTGHVDHTPASRIPGYIPVIGTVELDE